MAILQRWRRAVVEDATEAARKMQINEDKAIQGQDQALVQQASQLQPVEQLPAVQPTLEEEVALQTLVQQSRSKRKTARDIAPPQQQQRMAAIQ
eukprot:297973-Amphidinium_carterae.1